MATQCSSILPGGLKVWVACTARQFFYRWRGRRDDSYGFYGLTSCCLSEDASDDGSFWGWYQHQYYYAHLEGSWTKRWTQPSRRQFKRSIVLIPGTSSENKLAFSHERLATAGSSVDAICSIALLEATVGTSASEAAVELPVSSLETLLPSWK